MHCEYCSNSGIETPATQIVSYRESEVYDGIDEDSDQCITMYMCDCCADNGAPATAKRTTIE